MRNKISILFSCFVALLCHISGITQTKNAVELTQDAIVEFKLQDNAEVPVYDSAKLWLEQAIALDSNYGTAYYYYGYVLDRLNNKDATNIVALEAYKVQFVSKQFEQVNRLENIYSGDRYLLDPYTKISAIWGSLGFKYLSSNKPDSAIWALKEAKHRGGFLNPVLGYSKQMLDACADSGILVVYGDVITFSALYVQQVEKYRQDVTVIDANLLGTSWYPILLLQQDKSLFGINAVQLATIDYKEFDAQKAVMVNKKQPVQTFSWVMKPTYMGRYILRGDRLLLNVLSEHAFDRTFYFSMPSDSSFNLHLAPHLSFEGIVEKLHVDNANGPRDSTDLHKFISNSTIEYATTADIKKSASTIDLLNGYRYAFGNLIADEIANGHIESAKAFYNLMQQKFPESKLPFGSSGYKAYFVELEKYLNKNAK